MPQRQRLSPLTHCLLSALPWFLLARFLTLAPPDGARGPFFQRGSALGERLRSIRPHIFRTFPARHDFSGRCTFQRASAQKVRSLSLHSGWAKTDPFLKVVVEGWQTIAKGSASVTDMVIQGIFPWCFTPEVYASKPEYIDALAAFVRVRPVQPLAAFLSQSNAVIAHDAQSELGKIKAPTQITFGRHDVVTSTRFADTLKNGVSDSEVVVFEGCAHAP